ncbi:MAG: MoaD/ThiS family protein [Verrucomicrobiae bacterium]|nr:MoaD/ThiS family protein [Verrucomicrobiae bacterium]
MPRVDFTPNLARQTAIASREVHAETVREALDELFREFPAARSYVLDDQGETRQHVAIFVNGEAVTDRNGLSDPVDEGSVVFVMQALSGG